MLKKKLGKKVAALASAAVMAVSATATGLGALTASAGEELGEGTFNDGKGLPWHICESATGSMQFDITDGIYAILIENPGGTGNGGEDRWDCQFRHRNLTIESGHKYRLTYSVNPSNSGKMYAKFGNMADDNQEMWHGNGEKLSMTYQPGISMAELESQLESASKTGQTVEYGVGWDAWKNETIPANTWTTYAYEFTADQTVVGTAEWTFHMGGTGQYTPSECFPKDTIVRFDNLALIDLTDNKTDYVPEEEYEPLGVAVNQVGYYPNAKKQGTLIVDQGDTTQYDFEIQNAKGETVYTGTTDGTVIYDNGAWEYAQVIDFTGFTEEGVGYKLKVAGKTSYAFDISSTLLNPSGETSLLTYAMNYFYQNRSGIETLDSYIPSSQTVEGSGKTLGRKDCHNPDTAYISDEWVFQYAELPTYSQTIDLTGGWYDAGDYGKYVVNGGISLWTLMNMYERSLAVNKGEKWNDDSGLLVLPETGNGIPDVLDECKVELDFFLKMQRSDGMVYHKMHDYKWTGLAVAPYDDDNKPAGSKRPMRITKPVTYAATLNFAAACAQGSRLFEDYSPSYAKELKDAAIKAYDAAKANYKAFTSFEDNSMYAPLDQNIGGGPYGDSEVSDEFYWAACELYITTGDSTYYTELKKYGTGAYGKENGKAFDVSTTLVGGENNGTCSVFTWGTLNSVGTISMYVNADKMLAEGLLTQDEVDTMKDQIIQAGDYYLDVQSKSAYAIPYVGHDYDTTVWKYTAATNETGSGNLQSLELENGYEWGSNSMVINNTIVMALAYDETDDVKYIDGVTTAFDYLLGRNPNEQSFVTGYGEHSTKYPHHRWWSGQLNSADFPYAPYGVLSGGCNSNMEDPMIQGAGYKVGSLAPMKCYLDNVEAWSVNECTINWNSPLCWVASFIDDEAPNIERDSTGTTEKRTTSTDENQTTTASTETSDTDDSDSTTDNSNTTNEGGETTTVTRVTTDGDVLLGDVNLDGHIDLTDAILLNKYCAGVVTLNDQQLLNADCNGSGNVDMDDSIALLRFLVHLTTSLPND